MIYITEDYYRMYDITNEVSRIYNFVYIDTKNNYVTPQFMGGWKSFAMYFHNIIPLQT